MSVFRACSLFAALGAVAVMLVHLRSENVRCAARILAMDSEWTQLRRELWRVQTRSARLRAPRRLHERVEAGSSDLVAPGSEPRSETVIRVAARYR
ncbi:MAG: hypothetical protein IIC01_01220 [Planctomycetes bacterium]|nr:hypothetical protein [Planctomycetota bacterium]